MARNCRHLRDLVTACAVVYVQSPDIEDLRFGHTREIYSFERSFASRFS